MLSEWLQKAPRHFYIKAIGLYGLKFIMAPYHFSDHKKKLNKKPRADLGFVF